MSRSYSWWSGSLGTRAQRTERFANEEAEIEGQSGNDQQTKRVGLIVGVTGIVGSSLAEILTNPDIPGGPWKVYGVARRPKPGWWPETCDAEYIRCDALDRAQTCHKISALRDVTHLFWVSWVSRRTEDENCRDNGQMFVNVLDCLLPNAKNLVHVCLQTGGKHYLGSPSHENRLKPHDTPFREDLPRLPAPNFYYTLEDVLLERARRKEGLSWSVHRPTVIFGFSPCSLMNIIGSLAVYAAVCKKEGARFKYPGNAITWERLMDASDADLVAEQQVWAAMDSGAKNQAFNITNGDVFRWKHLWRDLAEKLEVEAGYYDGRGFSMVEAMKDKGGLWDEIVKENGLVATKFQEVGNWWFVDRILNRSFENVSSMNKSKEFGFFGFRDTQSSCLLWIDRLRSHNIIPSNLSCE